MSDRASWSGSDITPKIVAVADELRSPPKLEYAVADLYPRNYLVVQFGSFESFKSTDLAHLACATAYTGDYHGHAVKRGLAFVLAAEDPYGLDRRIAARLLASGLNPKRLKKRCLIRTQTGYALIKSENAKKLRDKLLRAEDQLDRAVEFIGIDTLMKNFGEGNENDNSDISHVLENIDRYLKEPFKALVVATTHVGHGNESRPRGGSASLPAVDMGIRMKPTSVGVTLECIRHKNGLRFAPLHFASEIVNLPWRDARGKPETSVILKLLAEAPGEGGSPVAGGVVTSKADRVLELIKELRRERLEDSQRNGKVAKRIGIGLSRVKDVAIEKNVVSNRQDFFKQKQRLLEKKYISIEEKEIRGRKRKVVFLPS